MGKVEHGKGWPGDWAAFFLILPPRQTKHADQIMDTELKLAYEQIDNQILRILLYFGAAAIATLSSGLVYLWHQWRAEQRERLLMDREATAATTALALALQGMREEIADLRERIGTKR